jgi:hypothetical protein
MSSKNISTGTLKTNIFGSQIKKKSLGRRKKNKEPKQDSQN